MPEVSALLPLNDPPETLEFFCSCVPPKTTSQMKRAVRTNAGIRFFKSKDQESAAATLEGVLLPHQPARPIEGLVELSVEFTWPWRKADLSTAAKRERAARVRRVPSGSKPDADNAVKACLDCLVALRFIERDELVCELTVRKFFGEKPGIAVRITKVEDC